MTDYVAQVYNAQRDIFMDNLHLFICITNLIVEVKFSAADGTTRSSLTEALPHTFDRTYLLHTIRRGKLNETADRIYYQAYLHLVMLEQIFQLGEGAAAFEEHCASYKNLCRQLLAMFLESASSYGLINIARSLDANKHWDKWTMQQKLF